MAVGTDPLSIVYNALWDLLEAHTGFTDLVKVGNRAKYDGWMHSPKKDFVSVADTPEVAIVPAGSPVPTTPSGSVLLRKTFAAGLVVGDQRIGEIGGFLPVQWELIRAFHGWETPLKALTWSGNTFVNALRLEETSDTLLDTQQTVDRGIAGWVAVLRFQVWMHFAMADVRPS